MCTRASLFAQLGPCVVTFSSLQRGSLSSGWHTRLPGTHLSFQCYLIFSFSLRSLSCVEEKKNPHLVGKHWKSIKADCEIRSRAHGHRMMMKLNCLVYLSSIVTRWESAEEEKRKMMRVHYHTSLSLFCLFGISWRCRGEKEVIEHAHILWASWGLSSAWAQQSSSQLRHCNHHPTSKLDHQQQQTRQNLHSSTVSQSSSLSALPSPIIQR